MYIVYNLKFLLCFYFQYFWFLCPWYHIADFEQSKKVQEKFQSPSLSFCKYTYLHWIEKNGSRLFCPFQGIWTHSWEVSVLIYSWHSYRISLHDTKRDKEFNSIDFIKRLITWLEVGVGNFSPPSKLLEYWYTRQFFIDKSSLTCD